MYEDDVTTRVKGKWPQILKALGVNEKYLTMKHGPCPFCGGTDRFRFTDHEGAGIYLCTGCGNGNGWGFVQKYFGSSFRDAVQMIEPLVGMIKMEDIEPKAVRDPIPALKKVAKSSKRIQYTGSVWEYLESRGFDEIPDGLREASLDFYGDGKRQGTYDTLVSLIQDFQGNGVSYHLTYTKDGKKADVKPSRKVMTPKGTITGGAIRLHVDFEDKICLAEGIETAYAAHIDSGLPAFATISAHGMETFVPPEGIESVWIYGDSDASYTGQAAAYTLAKRLRNKGIEAFVFLPDRIGDDFNDILIRNKERRDV